MSPWFSRGWTALELAKSRKVKVVFKGSHGPLIKDLDEDILARDKGSSTRHQLATEAIANLRTNSGITEINHLLTILGPRYTSWPRDTAIIAGLLVGVDIPSSSLQQQIYRRILIKIGKICHEHLFCNSDTMSKGFNWCPTSLLDMSPALSNAALRIKENGDVVGAWNVFRLDIVPEENYF